MTTLEVNGVRDRSPQPSELGRGLPKGTVVIKDAALGPERHAPGRPSPSRAWPPTMSWRSSCRTACGSGLGSTACRRIWRRDRSAVRPATPSRCPRSWPSGPPVARWAAGPSRDLKVLGIDVEGEDHRLRRRACRGPAPAWCRACTVCRGRSEQPRDRWARSPAKARCSCSSTARRPRPRAASRACGRAGGQPDHSRFSSTTAAGCSPTSTRAHREPDRERALPGGRAGRPCSAPDAEVHLVSHSRGGLIGELLARGMRQGARAVHARRSRRSSTATPRAGPCRARGAVAQSSSRPASARHAVRPRRLPGPRHHARRSSARSLRLGARQPGVDDPGLKANPVYDGADQPAGRRAQEAHRARRSCPGIEAMMPTSPLVRMLNRPGRATTADLHVLGGDLAGAGVFGRLKTLVTDFYYRDDHDLVVNTPAMLGGIERTARPLLDRHRRSR